MRTSTRLRVITRAASHHRRGSYSCPVAVRIRTAGDAADFSGAPGDPDDLGEQVAAMWGAGASRPEWCFVAEDESGARVGRVGYRVEPTVTNPAWLGTLPPAELFAFGLWLPWAHGGCDLGRVLFATTLGRLAPELPARLDARVNPEVDDHPGERVRLFDDIGMDLFQEKQGFMWRNAGAPIPPPGRLRFATLLETGRDLYRDVMARAGRDTLDRNDRWYRDHMDEAHWAAQMMEYLQEEDSQSWLVASDAAGDPVGMVAVSSFDPGVATVTFIGVVPEHRGHGYGHDLLRAATSAAHGRGFEEMLSDVDTLNQPMIDTMRSAGHLDGVRPWHIWHYRAEVATLVDD